MVRVLFVCMGNICRSPTAEGVFHKLVKDRGLESQIRIDSAGTTAYHVGEGPDPRSQQKAKEKGIDISRQRARKVSVRDFSEFDYILAMDHGNLSDLRKLAPQGHTSTVALLCDYAPHIPAREVPDPYYGGRNGFEDVFQIVHAGCEGLLKAIEKEHRLARVE